jgi:hypothetical protein
VGEDKDEAIQDPSLATCSGQTMVACASCFLATKVINDRETRAALEVVERNV